MNLPHGSRALLCVAFGAMLSAGCTRIADHQGAILDEQLVAAVQPGVDTRDSVIGTLGRRWNTRVIVVPGLPLVAAGPYRWSWLRHPNYVVVAIEGISLPLVHTAWITALVFTVLNAVLLLGFRIPAEDRALAAAAAAPAADAPGRRTPR